MYTFDDNSGFYLKSDALRKPAQFKGSSSFGMRGEVRGVLWNADGSLAQDTGWNSNLILDNMATLMDESNPSWYSWCTIGSSTLAPAITQTSIQSFLASQGSGSNPMPYVDYPRPPTAPNWERYSIRKWRFDAGEGTGNVNEFTLGTTTGGANACVRHVFPATIPKGATQVLDVFYRFYLYPDLVPRTGTVMINGVSYDWETSFYKLDIYNFSLFTYMGFNSTSSQFKVYDGVKGGPTTNPTGNVAQSATLSFVSQGSWTRTMRYTAALDECNTASGRISVITTALQTYHRPQIEVLDTATRTQGFPKDNTEEMTVDWTLTWGRYP